MAMKYIYALKYVYEKNEYDLRYVETDINRVIEELFADDLKDVYVDSDSFEFTLKRCTNVGNLRKMGKMLKRNLNIGNGFARQSQKMYAIARKSTNYIDIEFIDQCITSESFDERMKRSKMYKEDLLEWVNRVNYADIYSAQLTVGEFNRFFHENWAEQEYPDEVPYEVLYEVTLTHKHVNRERLSFKKENYFEIEHLYTEDENYYEYIDLAQIRVSKCRLDDSVHTKIDSMLESDTISQSESTQLLEQLESKKDAYVFTVHNVGQGLATSLSYPNQAPFFYFDYGIAYGPNKFTTPPTKRLHIQEKGTIVLSHMHQDHWCGFRTNNNALKAKWIVPHQSSSWASKHLIARIKYEGGEVQYSHGISKKHIEIGNSKISQICSKRPPQGLHQKGFAMYLYAQRCDNHAPCFILVSGDQDYDYQEKERLINVDILVACHHGGEYCWSKNGKPPTPVNSCSEIIYSYGQGNTHQHPSKVIDYSAVGWNNRYDTITGDYSVNIYI